MCLHVFESSAIVKFECVASTGLFPNIFSLFACECSLDFFFCEKNDK